MYKASLLVARSVFSLALVGAGACATAGGPAYSTLTSAKSRQAETIRYWRQLQDSVTAQAIADEQGPRVSIRAEFTSYGSSRRVEAFFNVKDDAYVFIGHLDANGIVKVLFPQSPDDDGFVRSGSYHTAPMFAGFETDYSWRRAHYYSQISTSPARLDSYDYGTGFMFIVASWRPLRLDRVAENGKWSTFQLASDDFITDPRPAVGELASILAGDNREAYTVEFAKYYRTNLSQSTYASSSFSSLQCAFGASEAAMFYPWLRSAYIPVYGYNPFGYNPFASYQYGFGVGSPCGGYGGYYGGYYAYTPFVPRQQAPPITAPLQRPTPYIQLVTPRWARPNGQLPTTPTPAPAGGADAPAIQAGPRLRATDDLLRPRDAHASNGYRQRGLITDEQGATPTSTAPRIAGESQRPSIVDMVGRRREEMGGGTGVNGRMEQYGQPRNSRESIEVPRGTYRPHNDGSSYPGAGVSSPRGTEARQFTPSYSAPREQPSYHPSAGSPSGGGAETRSAPAPSASPRIEHPSAPPVSSPRAEPAARPSEPAKPNPKS